MAELTALIKGDKRVGKMVVMMVALTVEQMVAWKEYLWDGKLVERMVESKDLKTAAWMAVTKDTQWAE